MVNERRPPPAWPLGWAPSCHTWVPLAPPPSKSAGRTGFFMSGFSEVASGSGQGVPFQGGLEGAFMGLGALGGIAAPWVWMEEGVTREGDWRVGRLCPCEIMPPPNFSGQPGCTDPGMLLRRPQSTGEGAKAQRAKRVAPRAQGVRWGTRSLIPGAELSPL